MKKYFSFEVQVLDDKNVRRRFRASNYQVLVMAANDPVTPSPSAGCAGLQYEGCVHTPLTVGGLPSL